MPCSPRKILQLTRRRVFALTTALVIAIVTPAGCGPSTRFEQVQQGLLGGLLSVWGTTARDVYFVGADARDSTGPTVVHYDGSGWRRLRTGLTEGSLWWVWGAAPDAVYMVGTRGIVLRYNPAAGTFERMSTPSAATLFGVWGASPTDIWAVGDNAVDRSAVIWHYDGTAWEDRSATLPPGSSGGSIFKVWGAAANDVWAIGARAVLLHWNGAAWTTIASPTREGTPLNPRLLTVHGRGSRRFAVGGFGTGVLFECEGATWSVASIPNLEQLNGVFVPESGEPVAVGVRGLVYRRGSDGWREVSDRPITDFDFHAVWVDPSGGVWAVGGNLSVDPAEDGMIWHSGPGIAVGPIAGP